MELQMTIFGWLLLLCLHIAPDRSFNGSLTFGMRQSFSFRASRIYDVCWILGHRFGIGFGLVLVLVLLYCAGFGFWTLELLGGCHGI